MKNLIFLLSFVFAQIQAQETHNFKIENGNLVYENILQDSIDLVSAKARISSYSGQIISEDSTKIQFHFK